MTWSILSKSHKDTGISITYQLEEMPERRVVLNVRLQEEGYNLIVTFFTDRPGEGRQECLLPWPLSHFLWELLSQAEGLTDGLSSALLPNTFSSESVKGSSFVALVAEMANNFVRRDDFLTMRQLIRQQDELLEQGENALVGS